jgi:uncharacterized protein
MTVVATPTAPETIAGLADTTTAPSTDKDRVLALDVLRGIAILGTLATNIGAFIWLSQEPLISDEASKWIGFAYGLVTNGYWIGLLTIMFGIGLIIQRESSVRRGEPWLGSYPWRAVLLIVEGFLNYLFIVQFDVLMGYGLTALFVCVVVMTPKRVQTIVLALGVVAHLAHITYLTITSNNEMGRFGRFGSFDRFDESGGFVIDDRSALFVDAGRTGFDSGLRDRFSIGDFGYGGYWESVQLNLEFFWIGREEIKIMFLMGIGVFLIGARLWEAGLFRPESVRLRKRVMWIGFGIGLPIDWGLRTLMYFEAGGPYTSSLDSSSRSTPWVSLWAGMYVRYFTATIVAFGVLALVAHFYAGRNRTGRVGSMLANVGRMALSTYLLQNLLGVVVFGPLFLDLSSKIPFSLGPLDLVIGTALIGAVLIIFSTLWLRRFARGPMETISHTAHAWLVRNTTGRLSARRIVPHVQS